MYGKIIVISDEILKDDGRQAKLCRCTQCNSEFIRQVRFLHKKHKCPSEILENDESKKWCFKCKQFLPLVSFQKAKHVYGAIAKLAENVELLT